GVVLHEMTTGRPPFPGQSTAVIFNAIVHQQQEPVTSLRAGVPLEMDWLIGKCLAKSPTERYQHLDDLIVDLSKLREKIVSGERSAASISRSSQATASLGGTAKSTLTTRNAVLFGMVIVAAVAITWIVAGAFRRTPETIVPRTVKFTFTPEKLGR